PIEGHVTLTRDQRASFDVHATLPALRAAPRWSALLDDRIDGSARLRIQGTFARGHLDTTLSGEIAVSPGSASAPPFTLRHGELTAHVHGKTSALAAEAELRAEGLTAMGTAARRITAEASGVLSRDPHAEIVLTVDNGSYRDLHGIFARLDA